MTESSKAGDAGIRDALNVCLGHLTGGLDGDYRDCDPVELARAALNAAQPERAGEGWQLRLLPSGETQWGGWIACDEITARDLMDEPVRAAGLYQVRAHPAAAPAGKWRLLELGETISEGDEYVKAVFKPVPRWDYGRLVLDTHWPIRRLSAPSEAREARKMTDADNALGSWLSAALDDPTCCAEIKTHIRAWFEQFDFALTANDAERGA